MRILALDQSSRITGWAIYDEDKLEDYGKIDVSSSPGLGERLYIIRCTIDKMIEKYNIDKVILEDIYMDGQKINNVQTFKTLAEVFGVLFELCIELNIPVEAVLSGTWKSTLGIKGKTRPEQKRAAQEWVLKNYGIKATQDEVDAICIGAHIIKQNVNNWDDDE